MEDRQKSRNTLKVAPTQCLWQDYDSSRKYLINNNGNDPVLVDGVGQIPSRFVNDVTGVADYLGRQQLVQDPRMKPDAALAMKVEAPKSLTSVTKRRHQYYTPVPQKLHGYAQMPR